jgi:aminoglycoside 3-N-acetyltransferase
MHELITTPTVVNGFRELGIKLGDALLVHTSLSSFGHVQGVAQTILEALTETVGSNGTLMMPTLSAGRFDPSEWRNPPVPEDDWDRIRYETPLYHPLKTPTLNVGVVSELFRTWPGSRRSGHLHSSFAAWGRYRDELLKIHRLEDRFGESSPLARFYEINGSVLFLGTGFDTNTCFHLAEYRQSNPPIRTFRAVVLEGGQRKLIEYTDVDTNSSVFAKMGKVFERECSVKKTTIGKAPCRLFSVQDAVDFAVEWLARNPAKNQVRSIADQ